MARKRRKKATVTQRVFEFRDKDGRRHRSAAALAPRLAQIGVVTNEAAGRAAAGKLLQGQRLVTREGALWRWDGFTVAAGAFYTGAIGHIGFDRSMQLSIAIRTILADGPDHFFQAGGAIVADSDPAAEYEETLAKAAALARALGVELP